MGFLAGRSLSRALVAVLAILLASLVAFTSVQAAEEGGEDPKPPAEQEIGIWKCVLRSYGACPPDGLGRAAEAFWTYPSVSRYRKISLTNCRMTNERYTEQCIGTYWGLVKPQILRHTFAAELQCPAGYMGVLGQCVEIEPPRDDKKCPAPGGSPVNAATGENRQAVTDLKLGTATAAGQRTLDGPSPVTAQLEIKRYYSSQAVSLITSGRTRLGVGWRTSFDAQAAWTGELASTQLIHFVLPDFAEYSFALIQGRWTPVLPRTAYRGAAWDRPRSDTKATITLAGTAVTLRLEDGTRYIFGEGGKLSQIAFADGYTQTLTYTGDLNTRVTDSKGRWMNFVYGPPGSAWAGLLVVTQGSDGQIIRYSYEDRSSAGQDPDNKATNGIGQWALRMVVYPGTASSIAGNPSTTYEYLDNMFRPYLVTKVTNKPSPEQSTWVTVTWTYDVKKRVTSLARNGSQDVWMYAYDDLANSVTVTDPAGVATTYFRKQGSDRIWRLFKPKNALSKLLGADEGEVQVCGDVINVCTFVGSSIAADGSNFCVYGCRSGSVQSIFTFGRCPGFVREG